MNKILLIIFLCISFRIFAEPLPVYYVGQNAFSVKGYDIEYEGELPFKIELNQPLEVESVDKILFADGGYKEILSIVDPGTGETAVFQTRFLNDQQVFTIAEAKELERSESYFAGDFGNSKWDTMIRYHVTLNDGSTLEVGRGIYTSQPSPLKNLRILPGDQIQIIYENQGELDFKKAGFELKILRNQKDLGYTFYGSGTARQSKPVHISHSLAYTLLETGGKLIWFHGFSYLTDLRLGKGNRFTSFDPVFTFSHLTSFYQIQATEQPNGRYSVTPKQLRAGTQFLRKSENSDIFIDLSTQQELPLEAIAATK